MALNSETLASGLPALRVAFASHSLALGGATTFLCNLAGEMVRRSVSVKVFGITPGHPMADEFARQQIPVFCCEDRRLILEDQLLKVLIELQRFKPTVVVANLGPISFEILRYVPKGILRFGVAHTHEPGVYRTLRRYASQLDFAIAVSRTIRETLEAMPEFKAVSVRYLAHGVPMPEQTACFDPDSTAPLRIIYLGRLGKEQKRVHLFPEILEQLGASGIPFHWTIAGDGPEEGLLRSTMRNLSPTQTVSLAGAVAYRDVPALLSSHQVFLLASDYEGMPLTLLEAMGAGLVPVVSDLPSGIREVIDEATGELVDPQNVAGYARAIVGLHHDRAKTARLSRNAWARARERFSVEAMADRWLEILPRSAPQELRWPDTLRILPPLAATSTWQFSPPMRFLRRLRSRLS